MNQAVYRILQLTIILTIAAFTFMVVQSCRNHGITENIVDLTIYSIGIICFIVLFAIMERDRRRDMKL